MGRWQKVRPGEPLKITAEQWNAVIDAAQGWQNSQNNVRRGNVGQAGHSAVVLVKNDSGSTVNRFGVMGLGDPIITQSANAAEFKAQITFIGDTPDIDLHASKFCIVLEPIADGKLGHALVSGAVQCQIDVTDATHTTAGVKDADAAKLASGGAGCDILWKESGTGTKWAIVRIGISGAHRSIAFSLPSAIDGTPGNVADCIVESVRVGADPGSPLDIYNELGWSGDTGGLGYASWCNEHQRWEIDVVQCGEVGS